MDEGVDEVFVVSREIRERTATLPLPVPQRALDYMESHGINYHLVSVDGHNSRGRWNFMLDPEGNRLISDRTPKTWEDWPEGFDYERFVSLAR